VVNNDCNTDEICVVTAATDDDADAGTCEVDQSNGDSNGVTPTGGFWGGVSGGGGGGAGQLNLGTEGPMTIITGVINVILGFLGIIAVIIILLGGFKWMTAQGNEDKVEEARNLIIAGVIGLVIIMSAFGIAQYVISTLAATT